MSEEKKKFDEAAFDAAVAKPNGWSGVADPVAEIRRMRDGDEPSWGPMERKRQSEIDAILAEARNKGDTLAYVRKALAGKPRNCDLYKDCNAAWKAYNALDKRERLPGFDHWLFEDAKQEGGAK